MSLNGSGTYVVNSAGQPVVASTLITAAAFNAFTADIATALSTAVFKDGQQTITANLPMGGFRLTGVGSGNSSRTMSASTGDLQDNLANWAGTAGGTANALTLTPTPAITAYLAGQSFVFKAGASANTSTTTVAISGLTTIAVQANGAACAGGEIQANRWYRVTLDSTSTAQLEPLGVNAPAHGGTGVANNALSTITISGAFPLTVTLTASTGVTFPTSGTLITTSGTETLTNKTINLSSNTLTGTTAQFNAALSDNDFATLAGSESLTNKKLGSLTSNGFVKTGSGDGTLSVDTATYLTAAPLPSSSISGLTVSNNGITPTTDLDIAAGQCRDRAHSWAFATDTGSSLTTSLAAYWKLNEATGIRKDSYGWYDLVKITGVNGTSTTGKIGAAYAPGGVGTEQLSLPHATYPLSHSSSFSGAAWVNLQSTANERVIALKGDWGNATNTSWVVEYDTGFQATNRFTFTVSNGTTLTFVAANNLGAPSTSTWYHLVWWYDSVGQTINIKVNNGTTNSAAFTGSIVSVSSANFFLGGNASTTINAYIDECALWQKVLSSQEITDLYSSGNGQTLTETISDSTNMTCAAMTAKRLSSAWSAGSSGGLLDTGSIAASKTYHLFAIQKADGTQDYVASLNPKKPTLPSGYLYYRRIRSVRTNGSSQVIAETQVGHKIIYPAISVDVYHVAPANASALARTMSAPVGIEVDGYGTGHVENSGNIMCDSMVTSFATDDYAPSGSATPNIGALASIAKGNYATNDWRLTLSRSGQLRSRSYSAHADTLLYLDIRGYFDPDIFGAGR